mgnify:CR=1 FL=1
MVIGQRANYDIITSQGRLTQCRRDDPSCSPSLAARLAVLKPLLDQISLVVPTTLDALDQVLAWFEALRQPTMQQKDWLQCQLALAEAFTNAVRHAHRHRPAETPIALEATLYERSLELRIWDCGPPFDLAGYLQENEVAAQNTQASGGRGLAILAQIADHLSYFRTDDDRNCLLIVRKYEPSSPRTTREEA